jgi:hypothetical protein
MGKEVQIYVKAVRRTEPDLRKLARALIQLVLTEQAESSGQVSTGILPEEEAS